MATLMKVLAREIKCVKHGAMRPIVAYNRKMNWRKTDFAGIKLVNENTPKLTLSRNDIDIH